MSETDVFRSSLTDETLPIELTPLGRLKDRYESHVCEETRLDVKTWTLFTRMSETDLFISSLNNDTLLIELTHLDQL
jgi:hypothetical protein